MYLGDERLNSLACYVHGAIFTLEDVGVRSPHEVAFLKAFGDWLGNKVNSRNGDCWFYLKCIPNAQDTVAEFFTALDEFLNSSGYAGLDDERLDISRWSQAEPHRGET